ncbi:MAG: FAD-dependent monooxygenase [Mycobacterium sp.]
MERFPVVIAGAGPVGLTLALELEHQGVQTLLIERNHTTTTHPKMDITNGRSMELFRRLGVAERLRAIAIPGDRDMVVSWVTSLDGWELTRFAYPGVDQSREQTRIRNDGRGSLEPSMRVSQILLEPALKSFLENESRFITVQYGVGLESFTQHADGVDVVLKDSSTGEFRTVRADYLAGCDGAGSAVRRGLGIGLDSVDLRKLVAKELGPRRMVGMLARSWAWDRERPASGDFYMVHFTSRDRAAFQKHGPVWHTQSPRGWTLISQNDEDSWTLHSPLGVGQDAAAIDPREFVFKTLGRRFDCTVLEANAWTPRLTVADGYGAGRVWLAGDAVHQVPPTGGYGMNTGVGDAIGLGWALAANVAGWGTPALLEDYERERRAVALRNRDAAGRHAVLRLAIKSQYHPAIHQEGWDGPRQRRRLGREIADLGNLENEADGIEWGYCYQSPSVANEPGTIPEQTWDAYRPTTRPGSRPPSVYLADGRAIFDLFGTGFTLLRFTDVDVTGMVEEAESRCVPVEVVDISDEHIRRLYERDLVLIRPDQHVAWRGNVLPETPGELIDQIRGASPKSATRG